jgi:hypothetical protein
MGSTVYTRVVVVVKLLSENLGYMLIIMLRERLLLEPGERESVPIGRIQTGALGV